MKKALGQTVRELKREVNKKVLKVPGIEQKVLDATSNEPWGPHGSHLADIAQATRNYHEYQMIMVLIWKRINDTGKNWRHVYKALTVLEYLVANGSERVIDEIKEHAYQISTLSDFQYIDSSGRDQGSNVRKKSQSLVILVNDKERIQEVRQKAAVNRDKFRNTPSSGGMYRPGSYSSTGGYGDRYDDDRYEGRYGSRDEDRNGYGREREWAYRDEGRDGDRYGRDSEERYSYRDDDYRGRSQGVDDHRYGSRSRSSDRDKDRANEEDGRYSSSRESGAKADDSQDGSRLERKFSEQNIGAPPSYEEAVGDANSPIHNERRERETSAASVSKTSPPPVSASPNQATISPGTSVAPAPLKKEVDGIDEFDPRGSFSAAPATTNSAEMDLLGSLSESYSSNLLAIMPATFAITNPEADASANSASGSTFVATPSVSTVSNQPFEDPFGDGPFQAIPSTSSVPVEPQNVFPSQNQSSGPPHPDTFPGINCTSPNVSSVQIPSRNPQFSPQEIPTINQNTDILADILPPSGISPPISSQSAFTVATGQAAPQTDFPAQSGQPVSLEGFPPQGSQPASQMGFPPHTGQPASLAAFPSQAGQPAPQPVFSAQNGQPVSQTGFHTQIGPASQTGFPASNGQLAPPSTNFYRGFAPSVSTASVTPHMVSQAPAGPAAQHSTANILPQSSFAAPAASQALQTPMGSVAQRNGDVLDNFPPQARLSTPMVSQAAPLASTGSLAIVPQPAKGNFEPKSAVWADTLSRGLVNLNISGSKINPLADIGIDFEAINRKEKRMEKSMVAPVSTVTMGKAMGSGSGIGRAGVGALRPTPNPMGSGMGMGGPGAGTGMGGYGGMNQHLGMGMGPGIRMNMGMGMSMGMGMNMGMGQGVQMQPPTGFPPGSGMPGGYNPMMGMSGHSQPPYGSGYR